MPLSGTNPRNDCNGRDEEEDEGNALELLDPRDLIVFAN
jgi:hypothetical protein